MAVHWSRVVDDGCHEPQRRRESVMKPNVEEWLVSKFPFPCGLGVPPSHLPAIWPGGLGVTSDFLRHGNLVVCADEQN